jgi:hypothetical protein
VLVAYTIEPFEPAYPRLAIRMLTDRSLVVFPSNIDVTKPSANESVADAMRLLAASLPVVDVKIQDGQDLMNAAPLRQLCVVWNTGGGDVW